MAQDFARIHQVVGVERVLDLAHDLDGGSALLFERGDFAQTDAVLTGAGAAGLQRQIDELGAGVMKFVDFYRYLRTQRAPPPRLPPRPSLARRPD